MLIPSPFEVLIEVLIEVLMVRLRYSFYDVPQLGWWGKGQGRSLRGDNLRMRGKSRRITHVAVF